MSAFSNKHIVVALLVAPILAIGTFYAIDMLVGEQPHVAEEGREYPLMEMPGCRWDGGYCSLENNEFKLGLAVEWPAEDRIALTVISEFPLQGIKVAVAQESGFTPPPVEMTAISDDSRTWAAELDFDGPGGQRLRLVASAKESLYYGDASLTFALDDRESSRLER
jgi:hypothetical protein